MKFKLLVISAWPVEQLYLRVLWFPSRQLWEGSGSDQVWIFLLMLCFHLIWLIITYIFCSKVTEQDVIGSHMCFWLMVSLIETCSLSVWSLTPSGVFTEMQKLCIPVKQSTVMSSAFHRGRCSPMVTIFSIWNKHIFILLNKIHMHLEIDKSPIMLVSFGVCFVFCYCSISISGTRLASSNLQWQNWTGTRKLCGVPLILLKKAKAKSMVSMVFRFYKKGTV